MSQLKFILTILIYSVLAFSSFATAKESKVLDVSKLTSDQVEKLNRQISEITPESTSSAVRREAEAWGALGANVGQAMVGAARELGVAASEFASTSLGRTVVFIVAYKIIGRDILAAVIGTFIITMGWALGIWLLNSKRYLSVSYVYKPILWGAFQRRYIESFKEDTRTHQGRVVGSLVFIAVSTVVGLMVLF